MVDSKPTSQQGGLDPVLLEGPQHGLEEKRATELIYPQIQSM